MNRRRVITIVAAVLLTMFGTVVVIAYVNNAEERAQEGAKLVSILLAAEEIPPGSTAASLAGSQSIVVRQVPQAIRAEDAVDDLAELGNVVTTERILADEPIVRRQFDNPAEARRAADGQTTDGMQVITIGLERQKALGGKIKEGDLVGVIVSLDSSGGGGDEATDGTTTDSGDAATSGMVLTSVEVTDVSGAVSTADESGGSPDDMVMVSLQVDETQAERIAFGAEFGRLWLTHQGEDETLDPGERMRTNIFKGLRDSP